MKETIKKIIDAGRPAALAAGAGIGLSKVMNSVGRICKKDKKTLTKFGILFTGITAVIASGIGLNIWFKKRAEAKGKVEELDAEASRYVRERSADADLYTLQRMADGDLIKTKAQAGVYRQRKSGEEDPEDDDDSPDNDETTESKITWLEKFKSKFKMPTLPPFLEKLMRGVPEGFEEAMLVHLISMLGAMCFSKLRAKYSDGDFHAPNLQVIIEGNWGAGKAKFEQMFKTLFERIINRSKAKIEAIGNNPSEEVSVIQTTGIGTSMARFVDMLAANQGCHLYFFNSEVKALFNDLRKGIGLNFDFLRKAFENGDICRNNRAKDSLNGIFPIFLNYTITGTPKDISTTFKKELEGGTLSRIAWSCIPEQGRYPGKLNLPEGEELETVRDQIDEWTDQYCCHFVPGGEDEPVNEIEINLDFVCKVLDEWGDQQYALSIEESNPARRDVRLRMAAIAFHCAMPLYILYGSPEAKEWQRRKQLTELVIFIANYCMERFLHKFGKEQNEQRKANQEAELVDDESNGEMSGNSGNGQKLSSPLITDVAELKRLHDLKDGKGNIIYGWDRLAKLSGMSANTVKRRILKYEMEHPES